tara:strand:- start:132 stop:1001 length:870 start_codon:yes stop_codon:yes gene_type:complete
MLKPRIIGVLIIRDNHVVQSIGFNKYLPVGKPEIAVEFLNSWGIDEIIILDISASVKNNHPNINLVKDCASFCHVPLSVGGGVHDLHHIENLIEAGADKVILNSSLIEKPELVTIGARYFGNQSIVGSIDLIKNKDSSYEVVISNGKNKTGIQLEILAKKIEDLGGGEIFLNSVERDGAKNGYDIEMLKIVKNIVNIPVILCGGAGHPLHLLEGIRAGANAVAVGNYFHYAEHNVILTKKYLKQMDINVRYDNYIRYENIDLDKYFRLQKADEQYLTQLRFQYIPEEKI